MTAMRNDRLKCVVFSGLIFIIIFNTTCFLISKVSHSNSHNPGIDSFVSKSAFWIIQYFVPSFTNYVCLYTLIKYTTIFRIINNLRKINRNLETKHKMNSKHILIKLYVIIIFVGFIPLVILEVVYNDSNFIKLWCLYAPSVLVNLYAAASTLIIGMCAINHKKINENLRKLSNQPLIDKIIKIQSNNQHKGKNCINSLFQNFTMYDEMYNIVCDINNISGFGIVIYLMTGITMGLSVTYSYITKNDVTNYSNFPYNVDFSREYCLTIFASGIWLLTYMSHSLQNEAGKTGSIVYELINLDPNINEEIILHGLQILNQKIHITAVDFFIIDFDITPEIIIMFVTHLSVFIQINEYYQ